MNDVSCFQKVDGTKCVIQNLKRMALSKVVWIDLLQKGIQVSPATIHDNKKIIEGLEIRLALNW